jgi:peptidyl-prolyl cis-trans isomerase A (cyclophilin A)
MRFLTRGFFTSLLLLGVFILGLAARQAPTPPNYEKLLNPAELNEKAPDEFQAKFTTTKGTIVIQVRRNWAPNGADRFYNLVKNGFYDNCRIFRMIPNFMVQFGINGDPKVSAAWSNATIPDDPVKQSNRKGYVSFAKGGPNSRTTQVFINFSDENILLDAQGFAPFGTLVKGTDIVNEFFAEYLDGPPSGKGPEQGRIQAEGNAYLAKSFPKLDYIKSAVISEEKRKEEKKK